LRIADLECRLVFNKKDTANADHPQQKDDKKFVFIVFFIVFYFNP